jgi:glycerophosphoryl diester phosphodiesterase
VKKKLYKIIFIKIFLLKADYLEQDLVLTRDSVPLVIHDIHLDEVTNVAKLPKYSDRKRNDSRFYAIDFDFAEIKGYLKYEKELLS